ncbi:beta strand repeat-containing protein [Thiosulfatimonas sediminis]|uniref:beta strand repeat-containing protein n=1 Tax=Thiosulfatimonas sediminis TaxID=2675054 RepID=UPI001565412F|nr:calcium-binding protein [Thiosulfatimonas sediminis]
MDTITGTSANDTINALDTTLTGLDTITGGDGTDTMIYNDVAGGNDNGASVTVSGVEVLNMRSSAAADMTTSGWTGLETINATQGTSAGITAATTTDVNVSGIAGAVAVDGGKDIAVTVAATGTTTTIGATTGAAGTVTVTDTAQAGSDIAVDGGNDVTITASGNTGGDIDVGQDATPILPTGAVVVSSTGVLDDAGIAGADDVTMGDITVEGGSTVTVTQSAGITDAQVTAALTAVTNDTVTQGDVTVTGGSATTSVTVNQDKAQTVTNTAAPNNTENKIGIVAGDVVINDKNAASSTAAGTITTVAVKNAGTVSVDSSALTTVNLEGTMTTVSLERGDLTATPSANTLTVNLDGVSATSITDAEAAKDDGFTTVNIVSSNNSSTLSGTSSFVDATTVNISGDAAFTSAGETLTSVTAINNTNTGGVTLGTELGNAVVFTGTAGSGDDSILLGANTKATTTGAGNDTVTLSVAALGTAGTVDAGTGDADTLVMSGANAITATATDVFEGTVSGFERLTTNAVATGTINLANLDDINYINVAGTAGTLLLSNVSSGVTVNANAGSAGTINVTQVTDGTADTINFGMSAATAQTVFALGASEFETIAIASDDSATTATGIAHVVTTLDATNATALTIAGDAGMTIGTLTGTKLTSIDASGVTKGAVTLTTGALASAATINGGAGDDVISAAAAVAAVTLNGNAGNDTLTGGTKADTINGGDGDDFIYGNEGADTLTGGAGADIFGVVTAAHSNGVNVDTITDFTVGTDMIGLKIGGGNEAVTYLGEAAAYGAVLTSFTGVNNEAVLDTSTNTLYVDVDGSQTLDSSDIAINVGVSDLSQTDFATLGTAGADTISGTSGVDTIYGLGGNDTIVIVDNSATLADVSSDAKSISTVGMDIVKDAAAGDIINFTAALGTDANYVGVTQVAAGADITKTVATTDVSEFLGLYDYATNTFISTTTTAADSASTTDVAATMYLYATADGTTATDGLILIGTGSQLDGAMAAGVLTLA